MTGFLDTDGQSAPGFNQHLRARRTLDEMLGLCKGIILDGEVLETEATALAQWIERHPDVQSCFPANVIYKRLRRVFADGVGGNRSSGTGRVRGQVRDGCCAAAASRCWRGLFQIGAKSRRSAHQVLDALLGYFSVALGHEIDPFRNHPLLYEVRKEPNSSWTEQDLVRAIVPSPRMPAHLPSTLRGVVLGPDELHELPGRVARLSSNTALRESLGHFRISSMLFYGYMPDSYYYAHYRHDRAKQPRGERERIYLEHRARFEVAFLAAFKAIERLLDTSQLRGGRLQAVLSSCPFRSIRPTTRYRRLHEKYLGLRVFVTYEELLKHFLTIRNVVAAHANRSPPRRIVLTEDALYEIQVFYRTLVARAMGDTGVSKGYTLGRIPIIEWGAA